MTAQTPSGHTVTVTEAHTGTHCVDGQIKFGGIKVAYYSQASSCTNAARSLHEGLIQADDFINQNGLKI